MGPEHESQKGKATFTNPITGEASESSTTPASTDRGAINKKTAVKGGLMAGIAGLAAWAGSHLMSERGDDTQAVGGNETPTTVKTPDTAVETAPKAELFDGTKIKVGDQLDCVTQILLIGPDAKRYSSTEAQPDEAVTIDKTTEISTALTDQEHKWVAYYRDVNGMKVWEYVEASDPSIQIRTGANDARGPLETLETTRCTVANLDDGSINVTGLDYGETEYPMPVGGVAVES